MKYTIFPALYDYSVGAVEPFYDKPSGDYNNLDEAIKAAENLLDPESSYDGYVVFDNENEIIISI